MPAPARAADLGASGLGAADDLLAKAPTVEDSSGWYLRGDVGYVFNETPDWSALNFNSTDPALGDAWLLGVGAGFRVTDWLRVDATADYRTEADYTTAGLSADYSVATFMANAYIDLGTWNGFTPYVGAGIGAGFASFDDIDFGGSRLGSTDGWGLAWGLMAGVAVSLGPNWMLDVGYRYLALDGVDLGGAMPDFDQSAHEIRIGARYLID
ncbi:outer membrane protein [Ancylobacter pratisalsi]|uniref:Porin family protein n=1 Tax=Ancylobacter pratisalsi TaxID=1745854 RepID=A0A6P1YNL6_9HYPH|nr:outer membrane protein [Ancylobacter pratisalsi]QIB33344.1 porin family protein [Ancylobacter pratisalsi]